MPSSNLITPAFQNHTSPVLLRLARPITSKVAKVGDPVLFRVDQPVIDPLSGETLVHAGTEASGKVEQRTKSSWFFGMEGKLKVSPPVDIVTTNGTKALSNPIQEIKANGGGRRRIGAVILFLSTLWPVWKGKNAKLNQYSLNSQLWGITQKPVMHKKAEAFADQAKNISTDSARNASPKNAFYSNSFSNPSEKTLVSSNNSQTTIAP